MLSLIIAAGHRPTLTAIRLIVATTLACLSLSTVSALRAQEVRDSAGVRIVQTSQPVWPPGEEWRVRGKPTLVIGAVVGDPEHELGLVWDALRLPDGRIVVADDARHELRFYSPRGELLDTLGREGEGPGEFESLIRIVPYRGDSIAVFDIALHRISILDGSGAFGRSRGLDIFRPNLVGALSDGSLLVSADSLPAPGRGHRATVRYVRLAAKGGVVSMGPFPRLEVFPVVSPAGRPTAARVPFAPYMTARVHDDRLYLGDGSRFQVDVYTPDGRWLESVRLPGDRRVLGEAEVAAYERRRLEDVKHPDRLQWLERMFEETPYPDRMAAFETFHVDAEGNLWLKSYAKPGAEVVGWQVVDASGRWLGEVDTPTDIDVLQIGSDFVLGRREAEVGVHQVVLYELEKGQ